MLFEITVYRSERNQTTRSHAMEIKTSDTVQALERAAIRFHPERIVEIRAKGMGNFQTGSATVGA